NLSREIIWKGVRQNEVPVSQALHERAGAEAIRAMIGKVRFADDEKAGDIAHQIVIHPEPAHRVMDRGINSHRNLVSIFTGDFLVNFKQISVAFADRLFAEPFDRVGKIEINTAPAGTDARSEEHT